MRRFIVKTIIFGAAFLGFSACSASKKATSSTTTPAALTYSKDVKPIIDAYCGTKCHSAAKKAGDIDLSNYAGVRYESLEGDLLAAIQHAEGLKPMPKNADKLPDAKIQIIASWIQSGAPE